MGEPAVKTGASTTVPGLRALPKTDCTLVLHLRPACTIDAFLRGANTLSTDRAFFSALLPGGPSSQLRSPAHVRHARNAEPLK
jgi:hypothetical protein